MIVRRRACEDVEIGPLSTCVRPSEELGCEVIRNPRLANQRQGISQPVCVSGNEWVNDWKALVRSYDANRKVVRKSNVYSR